MAAVVEMESLVVETRLRAGKGSMGLISSEKRWRDTKTSGEVTLRAARLRSVEG